MKNLIELFEKSPPKTNEGKICLRIIRETIREIGFSKLKMEARQFAFWLIKRKGVQIGDRIAVLGKNRVDWDIAFWGIVLAGAVPVLIDPDRNTQDVKNHIVHTESKILIIAEDYQYDSRAIPGLEIIEMTSYEEVGSVEEIWACLESIRRKINPQDTAVIVCTSGTTDNPKEVELTHDNLLANIKGSLELVKIGPKDNLLHILPAHHSFGLTVGKLLPFAVGATNIYTDKYQRIAELIRSEKITIFMAVPALFKIMAKKLQGLSWAKKIALKFFGWRKLRFCVSGSAPMPIWTLETFWKNGFKLYEGYGTTENSPVYGFNTDRNKLGSVGKPISTLSVKIAPDGEICLDGPCIMKGYYRNPEATQNVIEIDENGIRWLHTGDLGYLDEDGCLYITGRKKNVIVLPGGKKVSPERVELVLSQARYVDEVLVIPCFVSDKEENVKVIVRPDLDKIKPGTSQEQLKNLVWQSIQKCQQESLEMSFSERIKSSNQLEIKFDDFEKTTTGKIKRECYLQR